MSQLLNLADNPLFVKHVRSRLRKGTLLPPFIILGFLSLCIIWIDRNIGNRPGNGPSAGPVMFFWMQSLILGLMAGSQVATSVAYVRESGILDFHRVTPVSPARQALGFLLGAPIREWLLYAFSLPFALVCVMLGTWGVDNFVKILLVQITTALFFHTLAVVIGLSGKAKGASGRFVGTVILFNIIASSLYVNGIYGPSYLTTISVYEEVLTDAGMIRGGMRGIRPMPGHTFFGVELPAVVLTLPTQLSIGLFFFIAAARRFRSEKIPVFSKLQALSLLGVITTLTLGTSWMWNGVGLVLTLAYVVTLFGVWLCSTTTPPLGEYVKGLQRAFKKGTGSAPTWSDLASNKIVILCFGLVLVTATVTVLAAAKPGANDPQFAPWAPLTVGVLTLLSFGWGLQYFHLKYARRAAVYFNLLAFFIWVAPMLIGGLLMASGVREGGYLLAMTPILGISFSSLVNIPVLQAEIIQILAIGPPALLSLYFGISLFSMERKRREAVAAEHRVLEKTDDA